MFISNRVPSREVIDLDAEVRHWARHYRAIGRCTRTADLLPVIRLVVDGYLREGAIPFEWTESRLAMRYRRVRAGSPLEWGEVRSIAREIWVELCTGEDTVRAAAPTAIGTGELLGA